LAEISRWGKREKSPLAGGRGSKFQTFGELKPTKQVKRIRKGEHEESA